MKTHQNIGSAWLSTIHDVLTHGDYLASRAGGSTELIGYNFRIESPRLNFLISEERNLKKFYAHAELLWYLSGTPSIATLRLYAPSYDRFSDDEGHTVYGAYGPRGLGAQHLETVAEILTQDPETRQCVIPIWRPDDIFKVKAGASKDIPCTTSLKFYVRNNKLHLIVDMRSNDVWLGLPYDVFCFTAIQLIMAQTLDVECGFYQHNVGSMHIYDRNKEACKSAKEATSGEFDPVYLFDADESARDWLQNDLKESCPLLKPCFDHLSGKEIM